jgi:hypothetical protein
MLAAGGTAGKRGWWCSCEGCASCSPPSSAPARTFLRNARWGARGRRRLIRSRRCELLGHRGGSRISPRPAGPGASAAAPMARARGRTRLGIVAAARQLRAAAAPRGAGRAAAGFAQPPRREWDHAGACDRVQSARCRDGRVAGAWQRSFRGTCRIRSRAQRGHGGAGGWRGGGQHRGLCPNGRAGPDGRGLCGSCRQRELSRAPSPNLHIGSPRPSPVHTDPPTNPHLQPHAHARLYPSLHLCCAERSASPRARDALGAL